MRGINDVQISGNIGHVTSTTTHMKGDPICTFMMCSEKEANFATWVKCTAYGKLAEYCTDKIKKGDYVIVSGELFNKKSRNNPHPEIEIKVTKKIVVIDKDKFKGLDFVDFYNDLRESNEVTPELLVKYRGILNSNGLDVY